MRHPVDSVKITSPYGMREAIPGVIDKPHFHPGTDYRAPTGTPIRAVEDGTIGFRGLSGQYGNRVDLFGASGNVWSYAHLSAFGVGSVGFAVREGEIIGYAGTTGLSSAAHLHLECRKAGKLLDPLSILPPLGGSPPGKAVAILAVLFLAYRMTA